MSFSSDLKEELSKINNLNRKDEVKYELLGYLISKNTSVNKNNIRFATENEYNINRFSKLLKNLDVDYKIEFDGKSFIIFYKNKNQISEIEVKDNEILLNSDIIQDEKLNRAMVRGAFLGSGSMNEPEKKYHFEIDLSNKQNLDIIYQSLIDFKIKCKKLEKENKYIIYLKDGEEISKIIAFIGANISVLKFEDIRVKREMRGKVNRIVNCQTANLNKTLNASIEQIEAIKKLKETNNFNKLDDSLKEIAELRIEYPDMSLIELGKKMKHPIGKSGVNYRLKKIVMLSKEL